MTIFDVIQPATRLEKDLLYDSFGQRHSHGRIANHYICILTNIHLKSLRLTYKQSSRRYVRRLLSVIITSRTSHCFAAHHTEQRQ